VIFTEVISSNATKLLSIDAVFKIIDI
jgi:hypothetical protein